MLSAAGHDVMSILPRMPPVEEVAERASTENRILLTFDSDFGEMIYRLGIERPPSVIYFRLDPQSPTQPAELLVDILEDFEIIGMFTVINATSIRQRPLPISP